MTEQEAAQLQATILTLQLRLSTTIQLLKECKIVIKDRDTHYETKPLIDNIDYIIKILNTD